MMKSKHESKWDFGTLAQNHCVQPLATLKEYSFFQVSRLQCQSE